MIHLGTKKYHKIFWLYQNLPRNKSNALTISELANRFDQDCHNANITVGKSVKDNMKNAIYALYEVITDGLRRIPEWEVDNISGQTPRYYISSEFHLHEHIDIESMVLWQIVSQYTTYYLPASIQHTISERLIAMTRKHHRNHKALNQSPLGQWQQRIMALPSVTQAPTLDKEILATIHQALLQGKSLQITYHKKWHSERQTRQVYPIGLVVIDNMLYLTGFNPCPEHIDSNVLLKNHRNFAITRIKNARTLSNNTPDWVYRDEFSLESLYQQGKLEPPSHGTQTQIKLVLNIQNYACQHLHERPLSDDQEIKEIVDNKDKLSGWSSVTATVANSKRLEDWLIGMSQLAIVVEPITLRRIIKRRLEKGIKLYERATFVKFE